MKRAAVIAVAALVAVIAATAWHRSGSFGTVDQMLEALDPAKVRLVRTPGGFLQVSEMEKVEEFAWQTGWECPIVDCTTLPKTISRVRVKAHYVYRVPLAAEWRLEREGDHYRLAIPPLQLQRPVAFDTTDLQIVTTEHSVFSPPARPNREKALQHLGPELGNRGASPAYIDAQQKFAQETVREFARKWMREQGGQLVGPIEVRFTGPNPL